MFIIASQCLEDLGFHVAVEQPAHPELPGVTIDLAIHKIPSCLLGYDSVSESVSAELAATSEAPMVAPAGVPLKGHASSSATDVTNKQQQQQQLGGTSYRGAGAGSSGEGGGGESGAGDITLPVLLTVSSTDSRSSSGQEEPGSSEQEEAVGLLRVAIEADGPSHYPRNTCGWALGSTHARSWLLRKLGWVVVCVPYAVWDGMGDRDVKKTWLRGELAAALGLANC